ncbi:MAG: L,D-transpeptidase/peptidoglycan binding protein [Roseburia sp.]|nr:L,D-transpeptidase/peptidoglycan binding protein [Roseburia sp.]MCM1097380.1 L,D-transpeptidase/peptidoglycan binding protein [Ruminococcus flavefaciens]
MRKKKRILLLILLCGLLILLSGGLALGVYYQDNFPVNTWINGVYCTGKTIDEVNAELIGQTRVPDVVLVDAEGREWTLDAEEIGLSPDYREALQEYLKQHASFFWMNQLYDSTSTNLEARYVCDAARLQEHVEELEPVRRARELPEGCQVEYDEEEGYCFRDGNRMRLDCERVPEYMEECFRAGNLRIDLQEGQCYRDLEDSREDLEQRELWERVKAFLDRRIIYDMGAEQLELTAGVLGTFIKTDEAGTPLLEDGCVLPDEESVGRWVDQLAEVYDTCGTVREFQATRGDVVAVKYGTYGTLLDKEAEKAYLLAALRKDGEEEQVRVPEYEKEGFVRGQDDIGDTYIEVDLTDQHMYYYVDGELALDTDVVTGDIGKRRGTPEGINFVYNKERNRVLKGADYETPVKYWMPVKGGVGIHDADWRAKFGGEIYKRNGSHGCVNTPPDVMAELYEMVEIGTPVIMFY